MQLTILRARCVNLAQQFDYFLLNNKIHKKLLHLSNDVLLH